MKISRRGAVSIVAGLAVLGARLALTDPAPVDPDRGSLRGQVLDPTGAGVPAARVEVSGSSLKRSTRTDASGTWKTDGIQPGTYTVIVTRDGFEAAARTDVRVVAGKATAVDTALSLAPVKENVTVTEKQTALGLSPDQSAGAIVIEGAQLDALPDDPDELVDALQALAGAAAGPNGGQVFVDGFSNGRIPPKSAIRQIRLNSSPFSAEYDRPGFGRLEIFTRAGSDQFRGEASLRFNDAALNTRDPFAKSKPDYRRMAWEAEASGPLVKGKASFSLDVERRDVDDAQLVNATILGSDYRLQPFNDSIVVSQWRTSVSPRLDAQLGGAHTVTLRYSYSSNEQNDAGIGGFSLPSRGYDVNGTQHVLSASDAMVFGKVVNETRLQWARQDRSQNPRSLAATLSVQDAFTGGGSGVGLSSHLDDRFEVQDVVSWTAGKHSFRSGARWRSTRQSDVSRQGWNGTVTFAGTFGPALDASGALVLDENGNPTVVPVTSAERYRRTVMLSAFGFSPSAVRALGGGASQLQIAGGDPESGVRQSDLGVFLQDDWRARPNLTLGMGLRLETQTNVASALDWVPRLSVSWSPGYPGRGTPATVVRAAAGMFYDRVDDSLVLDARRFDGSQPKQYLVTDPAVLDLIRFDTDGNVAGLPSFADLTGAAQPQVVRELAGDLRAPATLQLSLGVDRLLPGSFTLTAAWIHSNTWRALRSRVVEAAAEAVAGGGPSVAYQYESTGRMRQDELIVGLNRRFTQRLSVSARYFLGWAWGDTNGAGSFPADSSDPAADWGPAGNDVRQRFVLNGSVTLPGDVRVSPFVIASSGGRYNITAGRDLNGDTVFTDRPAYASDPSRPGLVETAWGLLDPNPLPGATTIPRNLGRAPGFLSVNLRVGRTIRFGRSKTAVVPEDPERPGVGDPAGPGGMRPPGGGPGRGGGGRGGFGGGGGGRGGGWGGDRGGGGRGGEGGGPSLSISLSAQNLLNHVNAGAPVGNLSSPSFGRSLSSAGGFGRGPGGPSSAGNRTIELQMRASF